MTRRVPTAYSPDSNWKPINIGMEVFLNYSLKTKTTFGIGVKAEAFAAFHSEFELAELLQRKEKRKMILGGGSNILFINDFPGLIMHNQVLGKKVISEDEEEIILEVGGGENWHKTVLYTLERGWAGLENLTLIPGTVGAAPMQNIGAYGVELESVMTSLDALHLSDYEMVRFNHDECEFQYRSSIFKTRYRNQFCILKVRFKLKKKNYKLNLSYGKIREVIEKRKTDEPTLRDVSQIIIQIRQSKLPDPDSIGNAGSFFKNPVIARNNFQQLQKKFANIPGYLLNAETVKVPAAWLIESCGWKGKVMGGAGVYPQHALILINYNHATGKEIHQLAQSIQTDVKEKFGIDLEPEVNIIY